MSDYPYGAFYNSDRLFGPHTDWSYSYRDSMSSPWKEEGLRNFLISLSEGRLQVEQIITADSHVGDNENDYNVSGPRNSAESFEKFKAAQKKAQKTYQRKRKAAL